MGAEITFSIDPVGVSSDCFNNQKLMNYKNYRNPEEDMKQEEVKKGNGDTFPMTSLRLSLSLSMTVIIMVVSLSTWAGTSKGKDSLKTGFRQRFITAVFFFSTRLSLFINHTFT